MNQRKKLIDITFIECLSCWETILTSQVLFSFKIIVWTEIQFLFLFVVDN